MTADLPVTKMYGQKYVSNIEIRIQFVLQCDFKNKFKGMQSLGIVCNLL